MDRGVYEQPSLPIFPQNLDLFYSKNATVAWHSFPEYPVTLCT